MPHHPALGRWPRVVAAARRAWEVVAPLVRVALEHASAPRLPAPPDPLEPVREAVDEQVDRLVRGRGLDLRADRATVDVEIGLRHDRPLPGRVAMPGHPDPGVQDRLGGVGQHVGDLLLRVLDEIVRQAAAQLHDGLRQCGQLVCPAHAPTLLRNMPRGQGPSGPSPGARGPEARPSAERCRPPPRPPETARHRRTGSPKSRSRRPELTERAVLVQREAQRRGGPIDGRSRAGSMRPRRPSTLGGVRGVHHLQFTARKERRFRPARSHGVLTPPLDSRRLVAHCWVPETRLQA